MLKNFLKTSLRNLWKNKVYTLINTLGLSLGVCALFLAAIFSRFEHSYDQFDDAEFEVSRVILKQDYGGGNLIESTYMPYHLLEGLKGIPQIVETTSFKTSTLKAVVGVGQRSETVFDQSGVAFVEKNHFDFFDKTFLKGSRAQWNDRPNAVVLTESTATRYFGAADPVGRVIDIKDMGITLEVVGVVADNPGNSSMQFALLCSMDVLRTHENYKDSFQSAFYRSFQIFVKTPLESNPDEVNHGVSQYVATNWPNSNGQSLPELSLEPLRDLHLKSQIVEPFYATKGDSQLINWFFGIALILLAMGIINYANLTTATGLRRAKEIGIRKVVGAKKSNIFYQFATESTLLGLMIAIVSLLLIEMSLPFFESLVQRDFGSLIIYRGAFYVFILALSVLVSFLAGIYPSLIMVKIKSITLFHGANAINRLSGIRNGLLFIQFLIGFSLVTTALYMDSQLNYVLSKDLGLNISNGLVLKNVNADDNSIQLLKSELIKVSGVEAVSISQFYPGVRGFRSTEVEIEVVPGGKKEKLMIMGVDADFLRIYGAEILQDNGLTLEELFSEQSNFALLNETAIQALEITSPSDFRFPSVFRGQSDFMTKGVVKDFHVGSLHEKIRPMAIVPINKTRSSKSITVKYNSNFDSSQLVNELEKAYRGIIPFKPFTPIFLEDEHKRLYAEERRMKSLISILTGLSLFIAISGVLGLTLSTTQQRLREIGIRKILGAKILHLIVTQNRKMLIIMMVSCLTGILASIYLIDLWKTDFAYQTELSIWTFLKGVSVIMICTLFSSVWLTFRTAIANPCDVLRAE